MTDIIIVNNNNYFTNLNGMALELDTVVLTDGVRDNISIPAGLPSWNTISHSSFKSVCMHI